MVTIYVVGLSEKDKRTALSMHKPRHLAEGRQPTVGERMGKPGGAGGRGRGRLEEQQIFSRAARAPESRRGGRPGRKPRPKKGDEFDMAEIGDPLQRRGGRGSRGSKEPRVITVESDLQTEETRGHKGEFRSLAGLRALLDKPAGDNKKGDES